MLEICEASLLILSSLFISLIELVVLVPCFQRYDNALMPSQVFFYIR